VICQLTYAEKDNDAAELKSRRERAAQKKEAKLKEKEDKLL
jgi:hypothetical protein